MGDQQKNFSKIAYSPREDSYGAGVTPGTWHEFDEPVLFTREGTLVSNEGRVKGHPFSSHGSLKRSGWATQASLRWPLNVELFQQQLASLLANGSAPSGVSPNFVRQFIFPGPTVNAPWSYSMIAASDRGQTASFNQYNGLATNSIEFTVDENPEIQAQSEVLGDGSEVAAPATAVPAPGSAVPGEVLCRSDLSALELGPAAPPSIAGIFERLTVRFNAELTRRRRDGGLFFKQARYGEGKAPRLEVELEAESHHGDALHGYFTAATPTEVAFHLRLERADDANRYIDILCNSVTVAGYDPNQYRDGIKMARLQLEPHYSSGDSSPYVVEVGSGVAQLMEAV